MNLYRISDTGERIPVSNVIEFQKGKHTTGTSPPPVEPSPEMKMWSGVFVFVFLVVVFVVGFAIGKWVM